MLKKMMFGTKNFFVKIASFIKNIPKIFFAINLSHNKGTKILSLALAVLFWFFVMDKVNPEVTKVVENIPVQLINMQEIDQNNLIIMNQHDYFANIRVTGRRNNLLNFNANSAYLWVDMRNVSKGKNTLQINKSINIEDVSIQTLTPSEIVIDVDQIVSVPKPVKIFIDGDYQNNLYQSGIVINPDEVKVTGPESIVNTVSYVSGSIDVSQIQSDVSKEVTLVPYSRKDEVVNGVTLDTNYTNVSLEIGNVKSVTLKPQIEGQPKEGYKLVETKISPVMAQLSGRLESVNAIDNVQTEPINLTGNETDSFIVNKALILPEGITSNLTDNLAQVQVRIEELLTKEFNFTTGDIPVMNLSDNLKTNLSDLDNDVVVRVKDIESKINELSKEDIHFYLDFGNVEKAGLYRIQIKVSEASQYDEINIEPAYIEVEVTDIDDQSAREDANSENTSS